LEETVSVRKHGGEEVGKFKLDDFVTFIKEQLTINI